MGDYLFERECRFIGLWRTGNSAAMTFVCHHFKKNDIVIQKNTKFTFHPRRRHRKFNEISDFVQKTDNIIENDKIIGCYCNGVEEMSLRYLGYLMEDKDSHYNVQRKRLTEYYKKRNFAKKTYNILILRSFHNATASRLRHDPEWMEDFTSSWLEYAAEFSGRTNYIKDKILFNYDTWFSNLEYKKNLSWMLCMEYEEAGTHILPTRGVGSSFDGRDYRGRAEEMDVLNRWKYYKDDLKYLSFLKNKKVHFYMKEIFDIDLKELFQ